MDIQQINFDSLNELSTGNICTQNPITTIDNPSQNGRSKSGKSTHQWLKDKAADIKDSNKKITRSELSKHVNKDDVWIAINM